MKLIDKITKVVITIAVAMLILDQCSVDVRRKNV